MITFKRFQRDKGEEVMTNEENHKNYSNIVKRNKEKIKGGISMRRFTRILLITGVIMLIFSGPALASLYVGTWDSVSGDIETGIWEETLLGSYPEYIGSTSSQQSTGGQWSSTAVRGNSTYSDVYWDSSLGLFAQDFVTTYSQSDYYFEFFDNGEYTADLTGTAEYTIYFTTGGSYSGVSTITWQGEGIVNEDTNFYVQCLATGEEDYNDGTSHYGDVGYAQLKLTTIPIPSAVWLLGSGLFGLVGIRRRF